MFTSTEMQTKLTHEDLKKKKKTEAGISNRSEYPTIVSLRSD